MKLRIIKIAAEPEESLVSETPLGPETETSETSLDEPMSKYSKEAFSLTEE